jgi:hypothetical protein
VAVAGEVEVGGAVVGQAVGRDVDGGAAGVAQGRGGHKNGVFQHHPIQSKTKAAFC